jgi:hypothetical protein
MANEKIAALNELNETEIDIEGKSIDDESVRMLWAKQMVIIDAMSKYWRDYIERGKTCFDFLRGKIFDDETRSEYEDVYDKFVVEPRKMKPRINSLVGKLIESRRSGQVTTEGGSIDAPTTSAEEIEVVNVVLKHMEQKWRERRRIREVLYNSMVSCYPNWLWFEKVPVTESMDAGLLRPVVKPWDSSMVAPFHFREVDGSDITAVVHTDLVTTSDLIDEFPEREKEIREHVERMGQKFKSGANFKDTLEMWDMPISAADKDRVMFNLMTGITSSIVPSGFHTRYERNFQITLKETVAINIFNPQQYEIRPGTWDEERWQEWLTQRNAEENTKFVETVRPVKILWTTTITDSGLVLTNGRHWFQENGRMPGSMMIPAMIDQLPSGPAEDMLNELLAIAVARTEFLDDVRKNTGKVIVTRDGTISNPEELATEFSKPIGFMNVKNDAPPIDQCYKEIERKPNTTYLEYSQILEKDLDDNTLINKAMMGETVANQTGIAKQIELGQGFVGQSIYVENFNEFWENYQNLKLQMIPYAYNQYSVLQIIDEDFGDQTQAVEINTPVFDEAGNVKEVVNDITSAKYRWKMAPVDDSPTAKDDEQKKFVIFMNAVPGPVMAADPSGKLLAKLMLSMPNRMIRDAGKALAQDAEMRQQSIDGAEKQKAMLEYQQSMEKLKVESEKAGRQGFSLSITGEQLAQFPTLADALVQLGYIKPQTGGQQAPAPQQPAPQAA